MNGSCTKCSYMWMGPQTCAVPSVNGSHTIRCELKFATRIQRELCMLCKQVFFMFANCMLVACIFWHFFNTDWSILVEDAWNYSLLCVRFKFVENWFMVHVMQTTQRNQSLVCTGLNIRSLSVQFFNTSGPSRCRVTIKQHSDMSLINPDIIPLNVTRKSH